jgi:hypothetical protein
MTKHPLTDELCDQIVSSIPPFPRDQQDRVLSFDGRILDGMFKECFEKQKHEMRAAADWQLEQVEKSVERRIKVLRQSGYVLAADAVEDFFQGIMQNMRPQQDDNE